MMVKLGHGQSVRLDLIESILKADRSPMKRLRQEYKERGFLIDATSGRKTLSMILTTTGRLYLTAFQSETLEIRVNNSTVHKDNDF